MSRIGVPPPGRAMVFDEWAAAIVAGVRGYLPDIKAARKGRGLVIIRHDGREANLRHKGSECWITFSSATIATTMASMYDTRCDAFTVANFSKSIAGYLDSRFTRSGGDGH